MISWFNYTWIMSFITIFVMWRAGSKDKNAWLVGLANQILWCYFIYDTRSWGLIPMQIAIFITYTRNYLNWRGEEHGETGKLGS